MLNHCKKLQILALAALLTATFGCSAKKTGTLDVNIYGEDYIEKGIPAETFPDGWSVKFTQFDVGVSDVVAHSKDSDKTYPLTDAVTPEVYNLVKASGDSVKGQSLQETSSKVAPGEYNLSFVLGPYHIVGDAEKDGKTIHFDWKFDEKTYYGNCDSYVTVKPNEATNYEITVHADHLFAVSATKELSTLIHPMALADENNDGTVTADELKAVSSEMFDKGENTLNVANFWDFINLQARTLGHVNGETHCKDMRVVK